MNNYIVFPHESAPTTDITRLLQETGECLEIYVIFKEQIHSLNPIKQNYCRQLNLATMQSIAPKPVTGTHNNLCYSRISAQ